MNWRRKKRLFAVIGLCLGTSCTIGLILYALNSNMDLFYIPSEILHGKQGPQQDKPHIGQRIRVGGMVSFGSVQRHPETLDVEFKLHDQTGEQVTVVYKGLLPDLFREGQGIVAQGTLIQKNKIRAQEVLAKHDETYMPPELKNKMKHVKP
tara:strand:+ start:23529 stop:23981 length:453 start_codon:yes stop_codon:yes gene_type:complete